MTPEQINIAIAEACGAEWVVSRYRLGIREALLVFRDRYTPAESWDIPSSIEDAKLFRVRSVHHSVPRYCTDLNAMHEAEKYFNDPQLMDEYTENITIVMDGVGWIWHATAAQRAEAFLRTLKPES